jgi:hypothetical protein
VHYQKECSQAKGKLDQISWKNFSARLRLQSTVKKTDQDELDS